MGRKGGRTTLRFQLAALLHDIGKRQTKGVFDSHGNPSPTAHYYRHEFASAYESLFVEIPGGGAGERAAARGGADRLAT